MNRTQLEHVIRACASIAEDDEMYVVGSQSIGYCVDGVEVALLPLPDGWQERVIVVQNENMRFAKGLCLEPHDCAASKLIASVGRYREKIPEAQTLLRRLAASRGSGP